MALEAERAKCRDLELEKNWRVRSQKSKKGRRVSESESDKHESGSWNKRKNERGHREKRKSERETNGKLINKKCF